MKFTAEQHLAKVKDQALYLSQQEALLRALMDEKNEAHRRVKAQRAVVSEARERLEELIEDPNGELPFEGPE